MSTERNPQAQQMGDESMARNLAWQAQAIWPQEAPLFARYALGGALRILDLGCGTGEITRRLADLYPQAQVIGVDILEGNLELARQANAAYGERVTYEAGDAFALRFEAARFDLVVCRHMSQSVPDFYLVLDEIGRVLRPGGWLHLVSEDYAMLRMPRPLPAAGVRNTSPERNYDPDRFWVETALPYLESVGCDGRIGRHTPPLLEQRGYTDLAVDYVIVDTLRVPRRIFADIITAWRDGYWQALATADWPADRVRQQFNEVIASILNPDHYAVWHVPIVSGVKL